MTIEMERLISSKMKRDDLRTKVLQSLGFDIKVDEPDIKIVHEYNIDNKDLETDDRFLELNSDYEKLNFIPNDDNPVDLVKDYDVILSKYKDKPYELSLYYLELYPNVTTAFAEYLKDLYHDKFGIIIRDDSDLKYRIFMILKNLGNILILILYSIANEIIKKVNENDDKIYETSDTTLVDSYFEILNNNRLAIAYTYYTDLFLNNPDLVDNNSYTKLLDTIKSENKRLILNEFIKMNTNSSIINFSKEILDLDDYDIKIQLFSIVTALIKSEQKG